MGFTCNREVSFDTVQQKCLLRLLTPVLARGCGLTGWGHGVQAEENGEEVLSIASNLDFVFL